MSETLVKRLETYFTKTMQHHYRPLDKEAVKGIKDGTHITVLGGGIAGSAFTRQMASLAAQYNKDIRITVVNSTNCNYCGGLITNVALDTLKEMYQLEIPDDLVLQKVDECIYVNSQGSAKVHLSHPLTATLRTSRFGIPGFDDFIKDRISEGLTPEAAGKIEIIEPTLAKKVERLKDAPHKWRVVLSKRNPDNSNVSLDTDVLVVACGFRALGRPMLENFQRVTGYAPPPTIPASVTEVDTSKARHNNIDNRMFILDGVVRGAVVAFIPKGPKWLTLTVLNKKIDKQDLNELFDHPQVKKYIDLEDAANALRCHTMCGAKVYTGPSRKFYGDDWLVIGDLTGYGRILKDGYFAAFLGARLATETLIHIGSDKLSLKRGYHHRLKHFTSDNIFGRWLFFINNRLQSNKHFARYFVAAAQSEASSKNGSFTHAALRALATGELTYRMITVLFISGLVSYPIKAIGNIFKNNKRGADQ